MSAAILSCLIFALTLGGIVLGALLRTTLPQHHLSKDSQDVVRLGVGLIATIAALVLGLLIAAAKGSFDTQSGQVKQITADIILLDALLEQYGAEAQPIRGEMRSVAGDRAVIELTWPRLRQRDELLDRRGGNRRMRNDDERRRRDQYDRCEITYGVVLQLAVKARVDRKRPDRVPRARDTARQRRGRKTCRY